MFGYLLYYLNLWNYMYIFSPRCSYIYRCCVPSRSYFTLASNCLAKILIFPPRFDERMSKRTIPYLCSSLADLSLPRCEINDHTWREEGRRSREANVVAKWKSREEFQAVWKVKEKDGRSRTETLC